MKPHNQSVIAQELAQTNTVLNRFADIIENKKGICLADMPAANHVVLEIQADLTTNLTLQEFLSVITDLRANMALKFPFRNVTVTDKTVHLAKVEA